MNIYHLFKKEIALEWKQPYALSGILLFVLSTVFVVYFSFRFINAESWTALYWITMLFASVQVSARSFAQEAPGLTLYHYLIASAEHIIISRMLYGFILLFIIGLITFFAFSILLDDPVTSYSHFLLLVLLGSAGLAMSMTMVSAIASKAKNNVTLMAVLGFPVILPQLMLYTSQTRKVIEGLSILEGINELLAMSAILVIILVVSYILFPYLWRE